MEYEKAGGSFTHYTTTLVSESTEFQKRNAAKVLPKALFVLFTSSNVLQELLVLTPPGSDTSLLGLR